jgi:hypothetical protein
VLELLKIGCKGTSFFINEQIFNVLFCQIETK